MRAFAAGMSVALLAVAAIAATPSPGVSRVGAVNPLFADGGLVVQIGIKGLSPTGSCAAGSALVIDGGAIYCSSIVGGNPPEVLYNNSGVIGSISNAFTDGVVLIVGDDAGTVHSKQDGLALFGIRTGSVVDLAGINPNDAGTPLRYQRNLTRVPSLLWAPSGTTSMSCWGVGCTAGTTTTTGTVSAPSQTLGGDDLTWRFRSMFQTAGSSNANAYSIQTGSSNGIGSFNSTKGVACFMRFGFERVNATLHGFFGLRDPVATMLPSAGGPTSWPNNPQLAGCYTTDAGAIQLYVSDPLLPASATQDCGAGSFYIRDAGTMFDCIISIAPGGAYTDIRVVKDSTQEVCALHSTTVPSTTSALAPMMGINNGGNTGASNFSTEGLQCAALSE